MRSWVRRGVRINLFWGSWKRIGHKVLYQLTISTSNLISGIRLFKKRRQLLNAVLFVCCSV